MLGSLKAKPHTASTTVLKAPISGLGRCDNRLPKLLHAVSINLELSDDVVGPAKLSLGVPRRWNELSDRNQPGHEIAPISVEEPFEVSPSY